MKLVNKLSMVTVLIFSSIGLTGSLILGHGCADIKLLFSSGPERNMHAIFPLLALGVLIFAALVLLLWISYFIRHVVRTFKKAESFIAGILSGTLPPPLQIEGIKEDEIVSLFSTLNFMRDRQLNLAERLKCRIESEEKLRSEIEYCEDLQMAAFARLLPEMRRSAGIVKAYSLIELARGRENQNSSDFNERTILASLKRQSRLSRELDFISDVAKLERKIWSTPASSDFSSLAVIQELTDRCTVSLQARNIAFCSEYKSGLPDYLCGNRDLIYHLLHLLIRSVSRSLAGKSTVTFSCSGRNGNAVFEISDDIRDEHREYLAENYLNSFKNGTPESLADCSLSVIGLEMVRSIAEKTDCILEIDSDREHSTILRLTVPGAAERQSSSNLQFNLTKSSSTPANMPNNSKSALKILMSAADTEEAEAFRQLLGYSNICIVSYPDNETLLKNVSSDTDGFIISAPFTSEAPPQIFIPQLRRAGGSSFLPVLVIMPAYSRELALELAELPGVTGLVQPLNYAQAVNILRGNGKG